MKIKTLITLFVLAMGLASVSVNAAYIQLVPTPQTNDGSIDLPPSGFTATYSPTAPVSEIWFASDISPQNPDAVATSITDQFGGSLTLVGQNDAFSSGSISLPGNPFNVLAIHLGGMGGGNELLFFFSSAITAFNVETFDQGGGNNLSNFRAYNTNPVPVPAAVWLFASALLGLIAVARR